MMSQIEPQGNLTMRPRIARAPPTPYIPPHITTAQRESSIRNTLRMAESSMVPQTNITEASRRINAAASTKIQNAIRGYQARNEARIMNSPAAMNIPAFCRNRIEGRVQSVALFGGTRSGAAFSATEAQLRAPSRMELHRERNPELTQLRGQISDFKRGKLQLSDIQKSGIETRIQQLVEINKSLKAKGTGPKLGRPKK